MNIVFEAETLPPNNKAQRTRPQASDIRTPRNRPRGRGPLQREVNSGADFIRLRHNVNLGLAPARGRGLSWARRGSLAVITLVLSCPQVSLAREDVFWTLVTRREPTRGDDPAEETT